MKTKQRILKQIAENVICFFSGKKGCWYTMTYKEKFGTVEEYNKKNASNYLRIIEKDGYKYYTERLYRHIDLLTYPEIYMTDKEKEEKKKALAHIEKLKRIVDGMETEIDPVVVMEWSYLKDTEYPSWRE